MLIVLLRSTKHWVALRATAPKSTKLRASAVFMDVI